MAITITRTAWIDDDGSGTTGTVINNAIKTDLYNQIDGALAKAAQLNGGNVLNDNQTISGNLTVTGYGPHTFSAGGAPKWQITAAGDFSAGPVGAGGTFISLTQNGLMYIGVAGTAGSTLFSMYNSNGQVGSITTIGTTTSYNTTSDARLKRDRGLAQDLAALRAVRVHDFEWLADGTPDRGVFAQEATALFPRAVVVGDDADVDGLLAHPWMTDYSKFVADLIVGWQQHDAEIADLCALIATLKGMTDAQ